MSIKIIFSCDVCRTDMPPSDLLAIHFNGFKSGDFELREADKHPGNQHQGQHICHKCLDSLCCFFAAK